jgi:hypothetical protein
VLVFRTVFGKITVAGCSNNAFDNRMDRDSSVGIANCYGLDGRHVNHPRFLARRLENEWSSNVIPALHRQDWL